MLQTLPGWMQRAVSHDVATQVLFLDTDRIAAAAPPKHGADVVATSGVRNDAEAAVVLMLLRLYLKVRDCWWLCFSSKL